MNDEAGDAEDRPIYPETAEPLYSERTGSHSNVLWSGNMIGAINNDQIGRLNISRHVIWRAQKSALGPHVACY